MNAEEEGYYDVETMKKIGDRIHYNNHIAITLSEKSVDLIEKISMKRFE
ncbi:hypothetical protein BTM355_11460 [Helicobacter pylori]